MKTNSNIPIAGGIGGGVGKWSPYKFRWEKNALKKSSRQKKEFTIRDSPMVGIHFHRQCMLQ